ncbi:MAG: hypothetical protein DHS20C21_08770 [Gemmatimonadota bacterium]|nr:MAG: hypothetical protein DHS20C21_08770 [Gemmatimonadota bacterium]
MSRRLSLVFLVLTTLVALATVVYLTPRVDPFFDDDSTAYVEAGRNFAAGRGFVIWPYGLGGFREEFVPLVVFPPGFPFLISLGVRLGASAEAAAIWIPRICFLLMPALLYRVFRFVMPRGVSLVAAVISCLTPPVVFHSMCAMSDVPFLFATLLGFWALFRGVSADRRRWIVAAGVVAGLAAGIRNAGYAVPVAVVAAFVLGGPWRRLSGYLVGFALGYSPIVIRNLVVFGIGQPYHMPPSGLSAGAVVRETFRAFDAIFVAFTVSWAVVVPLLLALVGVSTVWLFGGGRFARLRATQPARLLCGSVLALYAVAGVSMIVITRYVWDVDPVNPRFLIQYHWVFVAWCSVVIGEGLSTSRVRSSVLRGALAVAIVGCLLVPQVGVARNQIEDMMWARGIAEEHRGLVDVIAALPEDACVVAFHAPQLHLMYRRPVYQLDEISPEVLSALVGPERPLVVIVFPFEPEMFHHWWEAVEGDPPAGFREIGRSGEVIAVERPRGVL